MSVLRSLIQISPQSLKLLEELPRALRAFTGNNEKSFASLIPEELTSDPKSLIKEMRKREKLDLGTNWGIVSYIFHTIYGINIFYGKHRVDHDLAYFEHYEVKKIAKSLKTISDESIHISFNFGMANQPKIYRFDWSEENMESSLAYTFRYCNLAKNFYLDAAKSGYATITIES